MKTVQTEELRNYCVYLITCLVNGKQYAGKTSQGSRERWTGHKRDARNGSDLIFSRAIRKHGERNFTVSVLRENLTYTEANQEERLAIKTLNLLDRDFGYNMTEGGEGSGIPGEEARQKMSDNNAGKRRDIPVSEVVDLYRKGKSTHQIAEHFKTVHATIRRFLRAVGEPLRSKSNAKVVRWGLTATSGDILEMYRSGKLLTEISEKLGISTQTIRRRLIASNEPLRSMSEAHRIARRIVKEKAA